MKQHGPKNNTDNFVAVVDTVDGHVHKGDRYSAFYGMVSGVEGYRFDDERYFKFCGGKMKSKKMQPVAPEAFGEGDVLQVTFLSYTGPLPVTAVEWQVGKPYYRLLGRDNFLYAPCDLALVRKGDGTVPVAPPPVETPVEPSMVSMGDALADGIEKTLTK